jgi:biopolymer transport protein ExbB/TolQ
MFAFSKVRRIVAAACFVAGCGVAQAAETGSATSTVSATREAAKKGTTTAVELQKLVEQVSAQREKMIADHDALARQLKQATEEQRKAILAQMHEQKKEFEAAQSALHKQIRDEQRRLRQTIGKR